MCATLTFGEWLSQRRRRGDLSRHRYAQIAGTRIRSGTRPGFQHVFLDWLIQPAARFSSCSHLLRPHVPSALNRAPCLRARLIFCCCSRRVDRRVARQPLRAVRPGKCGPDGPSTRNQSKAREITRGSSCQRLVLGGPRPRRHRMGAKFSPLSRSLCSCMPIEQLDERAVADCKKKF